MTRRKSFGEKLVSALILLGVKLAFIALAFWFCFFVLPDIITGMFLDVIDSPTP